jgi:aspartate/methionine/tyrosine aminotransferase
MGENVATFLTVQYIAHNVFLFQSLSPFNSLSTCLPRQDRDGCVARVIRQIRVREEDMKIRDFGVEIWMNRYETKCEWNLAETCVESLTVAELLEMAGKTGTILSELLPLKLTYGAIEGSDRLRRLIAGLYEKQAVENVVVTHGAIGANALVHETLVEPGDRVISVLPTYQQHYSIPESYGADLQILKLSEANGFLPDLQELRRLATPGTKLIVLNNPNNPTGALMDRAYLEKIVEIARISGAWILCDEVYRGTDQQGDGMTASIADLYEKGISTGSMSKTYSLAGLRLGWIVAPSELIHAVSIHRDYNTISVGMLDDHFAAIALENRDKILSRSQTITRTNLAILSEWIESEPLISWVKPKSGTTALLKYDLPMSSEAFCIKLLERTGVMLTPGSAMDVEGYLRIGYANSEAILREGLKRLSQFLKEQQ